MYWCAVNYSIFMLDIYTGTTRRLFTVDVQSIMGHPLLITKVESTKNTFYSMLKSWKIKTTPSTL